MPKFDKLLLLLNLLQHRPYVTLETFMRECEIGPRTAYRYINSPSSAWFPVDYDKSVGGYRLVNKVNLVSALAPDEAAIILFGVILLENPLSPESLHSAKRVRTKLEEKLPSRVQEVLAAGQGILAKPTTPDVLRDYILMSIVNFARKNRLTLTVRRLSEDNETSLIQISKPTILFDKEWTICGQTSEYEAARVPLRSVLDFQLA